MSLSNFSPEVVPSNVVSLNAARVLLEESNRLNNFKKYLSVLKTEELLIEVKELVKNLTREEISREIIQKGKLVLSEISTRLGPTAPVMSVAIKKIQKELEQKINEVERLFVINID